MRRWEKGLGAESGEGKGRRGIGRKGRKGSKERKGGKIGEWNREKKDWEKGRIKRRKMGRGVIKTYVF